MTRDHDVHKWAATAANLFGNGLHTGFCTGGSEEWFRYPCGDPSGIGQMRNCIMAGLYQERNQHAGGIVYVPAVW